MCSALPDVHLLQLQSHCKHAGDKEFEGSFYLPPDQHKAEPRRSR